MLVHGDGVVLLPYLCLSIVSASVGTIVGNVVVGAFGAALLLCVLLTLVHSSVILK